LARNISNKLDVNGYSSAHLALVLLLHYPVKCRSRSLAVYNNEFILVVQTWHRFRDTMKKINMHRYC